MEPGHEEQHRSCGSRHDREGRSPYAIPFYGTKRPLLIDLIDEPDEKIGEWGYNAIRRKGNALIAENSTIDPDNTVRILWGLAAPIFDAGWQPDRCQPVHCRCDEPLETRDDS